MTNRMSLRVFFTVLFGAIAAGTIATCPALGDAIEQFGDNPTKEIGNPDKIANLLRMYREVISLRNEGKDHLMQFDDAIIYALDNFDSTDAPLQEIRLLLDEPAKLGIVLMDLDEEALGRIAEGVVPVAVMRDAISAYTLKINPKESPAFRRFVVEYKSVLHASVASV